MVIMYHNRHVTGLVHLEILLFPHFQQIYYPVAFYMSSFSATHEFI